MGPSDPSPACNKYCMHDMRIEQPLSLSSSFLVRRSWQRADARDGSPGAWSRAQTGGMFGLMTKLSHFT
jgi:hypothetical protein